MKNVLRAGALVLAGVLLGVAGSGVAQNVSDLMRRFTDVPQEAYYSDAVYQWRNRGVLQGYDTGRFGPDDAMTRGQVAVLLQRYDREMVQPLRERLRQVEQELGIEPPADDDNADVLCRGQYKPGEVFVADDGCNTCRCGEDGMVSCTLMACPPNPATCFSDNDCTDGKVCSTRYGDCKSACNEADDPCIQACAGTCVEPRDKPLSCVDAKQELTAARERQTACRTDADCTLYEQSCPFITCGEAVHVNDLAGIEQLEEQYFSACDGEPISCAGCVEPGTPVCENSKCVLR